MPPHPLPGGWGGGRLGGRQLADDHQARASAVVTENRGSAVWKSNSATQRSVFPQSGIVPRPPSRQRSTPSDPSPRTLSARHVGAALSPDAIMGDQDDVVPLQEVGHDTLHAAVPCAGEGESHTVLGLEHVPDAVLAVVHYLRKQAR